MAPALSPLPDARVDVPPLGRGAIAEVTQEGRGPRIEIVELVAQYVGGLEDLAHHVELALAPRLVANAYRPARAVAGQVVELVLGEVALTLDAEHDLHVTGGLAPDRGGHPVEEAMRFVRACRHPQGSQGQAGVAQPREPVVPIGLAPAISGSDVVGAATIAPLGW